MGTPRNVRLLVLLALAISLAVMGIAVWTGAGARPPAARPEEPEGVDPIEEEPSGSGTTPLDLPGEVPGPREAGVAPPVPPDLAAAFEKRYRGFTPEQLALAHGKLGERIRFLARPRVEDPERTRDLRAEIAWLAERLPRKEEGR